MPLAAALWISDLHAQHQTQEVVRIADGVYGSIYSEMKRDPVESNSMFVIGSTGVLVVDAHYTPAGARKTIAAIRQLTPLPVRYVVTTHWHDDHVFGNQAYRDAFPGVQFIAHAQTRDLMAKFIVQHRDQLIASYGRGVPRIEDRLAQVHDAVARGMSLEDTRKAVNLDSFRSRFLEGSPDDRLGTWNASIMSSGIEAAYEEAVAGAAKAKG
jgi:cyclase